MSQYVFHVQNQTKNSKTIKIRFYDLEHSLIIMLLSLFIRF
jgi:hypothetical protein